MKTVEAFLEILLEGNKLKEAVNLCENDYLYFLDIVKLAENHKLLQNLLEILNRNQSGITNYISEYYLKNLEANEIEAKKQLDTLSVIFQNCNSNDFIWIKGQPQSLYIYNNALFRFIGDMDLLVNPLHVKRYASILESLGFAPLGIVNSYINLRYSVNYHEIQMHSPYDAYIELKSTSGEMDVFCNAEIQNAFFSNTKDVIISGIKLKTLNNLYTQFHLFLAAASNATTYFFMYDNGLREMYEIYILAKKKRINYVELAMLAKQAGVSGVIRFVMKRINSLLGQTFSSKILDMFCLDDNPHPISIFYETFEKNYLSIISPFDEFSEDLKREAYFRALVNTYYTSKEKLYYDCLDRDILDYDISVSKGVIYINFFLNKLFIKKQVSILFRLLNSNTSYIREYGFFSDLEINFSGTDVKARLYNSENHFKGFYTRDCNFNIINNSSEKIHLQVSFALDCLQDKKYLCYNIQVLIPNSNDSEMFRITELCPIKNTLCIFQSLQID